jgi:hypothetical protein
MLHWVYRVGWNFQPEHNRSGFVYVAEARTLIFINKNCEMFWASDITLPMKHLPIALRVDSIVLDVSSKSITVNAPDIPLLTTMESVPENTITMLRLFS